MRLKPVAPPYFSLKLENEFEITDSHKVLSKYFVDDIAADRDSRWDMLAFMHSITRAKDKNLISCQINVVRFDTLDIFLGILHQYSTDPTNHKDVLLTNRAEAMARRIGGLMNSAIQREPALLPINLDQELQNLLH